ncbi:hypothetical protein QL285_043908 [Trifolium repens]|nr:hypothetical protein QL285_043908 [Trifolium repens]
MDGFKHCLVYMLSNLLKGKWNSMRGAWLGNSRSYYGSRTAIWPDGVEHYFYGRKSYIATYWEHCHLQDYRRGGFLGVTDRGGDSKSEKVIAFLQELFDVKFKNQDQRLFLLSMALTNAKKNHNQNSDSEAEFWF